MQVEILAFGVIKEILGGSSVRISCNDLTTVEELKANLVTLYPRLVQLKSFTFAVNSEYASAGTVVREGDEVALIPPVSGG